MNLTKYFYFFILIFISSLSYSQLDSKHFLPPLKQTAGTGANATRANNTNAPSILQQAIYLSTPEITAFTVNVYRGVSTTPWRVITNLSNTNPHVINNGGDTDTDPFTTGGLGNGNNNITLVNNGNTGIVLTNSGLRFESPGGEKFYVNYRGRSGAQAGSLTSKGIKALGVDFRWGGIPNIATNGNLSTSLGIMATEDGTRVNIFGYDPGCEFREGTDPDGITDDNLEIFLDAGETYVLEAQQTETAANQNGWLGATITATRNIAIVNGGLNFGVASGSGSRDVGIDQPVSTNVLGREYVFVRGNGNTSNEGEFPVIVATEDGTQVFAGGNLIGTINNGDYLVIPGSNYSNNLVGANMHVTTSKNTYAYQCLSGASGRQTLGMNFIAPVNCLLPDTLNEVPQIHRIAGVDSNISALTITVSTLTADGDIEVYENGTRIPLTNVVSVPVAGTSDWKTVYVSKGNGTPPNDDLTGEISVVTPGPISVGTFMSLGANAGLAGYFSGFDTVPQVFIDITGGGCFPGSDLEEVTGDFQAYQWYKNDVLIPGATAQVFDPSTEGVGDYFVRVTKGTCSYDSGVVTLYTCDPDIQVTKIDNADPILEGDEVTFTITVRSFGVDPVNNLVINDVLPSQFDLVSGTPSPGSGTWTSPNWDIGTINPSQIFTIAIVAKAKDESGGVTATNTITYTSDSTEPVPNITPDDLTEPVTILNGEIALTKEGTFNDGGNGTQIGDLVNYTFTVTNPGEVELENVIVNDPLLGGNISGPASGDTDNDNKLDVGETWIYNASFTTTLANFQNGKVDNTATANGDQTNSLTKTNSSSDSVDLISVDLNLTKTVDNAIPKIGSVIIYTLTLKNNGPFDATNVQVIDVLPNGLTYRAALSTIPAGTTYNTIADVWDLSGITFNNGETIVLNLAAVINSAGTIINTAEVKQNDQLDIDSTPNSGN